MNNLEAAAGARIANHDAYIRSAWWKHRRAQYFKSHKRQCARCMKTKGIHLHHKTYERVGAEKDKDLTPLCESCHMLVHRAFQLSQARRLPATLATITEQVIADGRRQLAGMRARGRRERRRTGSVRKDESFVPRNRRELPVNERLDQGRLSGLPIRLI